MCFIDVIYGIMFLIVLFYVLLFFYAVISVCFVCKIRLGVGLMDYVYLGIDGFYQMLIKIWLIVFLVRMIFFEYV